MELPGQSCLSSQTDSSPRFALSSSFARLVIFVWTPDIITVPCAVLGTSVFLQILLNSAT